MRAYLDNALSWFGDFPDKRTSIGGRLDNFIFCRREHLAVLTPSYLEELLENAGLTPLGQCLPARDSFHPSLFQDCLALEEESDPARPHTLIIEALKP